MIFVVIYDSIPIYAFDINDYIDHVAAQFVRLHVYRGAVCCNVNLCQSIK